MIRRLAKHAAALVLPAVGAHRLADALSAPEPLVLCYHRVVEDCAHHPWCAPSMMVSLAALERQLDWIGRRFEFADLDRVGAAFAGAAAGRRRLAAVTFDDGYADVAHLALPLLRRKGIPFAVFVVTGLVGTDRLQVHDELYWALAEWGRTHGTASLLRELRRRGFDDAPTLALAARPDHLPSLKERLLESRSRSEIAGLIAHLRAELPEVPEGVREDLRSLDWSEIRWLRANGTTIGSHTRQHRILAHESAADVVAEVAGSKRDLESRLGGEVAHLSFPDGDSSPAALAAAAAAGYRCAFITCRHRSSEHPMLTLPRRTFWDRSAIGVGGGFSGAIAECEIRGTFDRLRPCHCRHRAPRAQRPPLARIPAAVAEEAPAATPAREARR